MDLKLYHPCIKHILFKSLLVQTRLGVIRTTLVRSEIPHLEALIPQVRNNTFTVCLLGRYSNIADKQTMQAKPWAVSLDSPNYESTVRPPCFNEIERIWPVIIVNLRVMLLIWTFWKVNLCCLVSFSLCTDPSVKGGKGLCNYEPKLAEPSRN